jgi:hypothetical protein
MTAELAQLCSDASGLQAWLSQAMSLQVPNTSPLCTMFVGVALTAALWPYLDPGANCHDCTHSSCCMTVQCPARTRLLSLCCRLGRCPRPLQHALLAQPPQRPHRWAA